MSRFDSLDRLLAHDDNFRELLTILTGGVARHNDAAGEAGSGMLDRGRGHDMISEGSGNANSATTDNSLLPVASDENGGSGNDRVATIADGAGAGAAQSDQQIDHYSLLHTIEHLHGLPALGQSASDPVTSTAPIAGSARSTGETHATGRAPNSDSPPVTDPAPADPTPAASMTLPADFATSNLDAGPYWAMNATWNVVKGRACSTAPMAASRPPLRSAPPRNMRRWINTLPQQHFTDANGMQWTVAENKSVNPPVVMFVPSKFLVERI